MTKKVILITGASSGIGYETALRLLKDGYIVYGAARRLEKMQSLVDAGGHALEMDVTDQHSVVNAVKRIHDEQKRIDILFNNAGYAIYGSIEDTNLADARRQFEVNLFGLAAVTKEVLPVMRKQQSGLIINTSSIGGKIFTPLGAWYHASKHALEGWSDCLRLEVKQFGIDVVIIEPGIIATEFDAVMFQPMLDRSGKGPYGQLTGLVARATKATYEKRNASPATVIAEVVAKAINAKNPKTRYIAGKMARPILFARKYLSDRLFEKVVMSQVK